jgi:hypothetical protein
LIYEKIEETNKPSNIEETNENSDSLVVETEKLTIQSDEQGLNSDKKHQTRGGKGLVRDESLKLDKEAAKRAVLLFYAFQIDLYNYLFRKLVFN